jgi:glutamine phosphoribosylpyrophosphate amidotransferase
MCGISAISRSAGKSSIPNAIALTRHLALAIEHRGPHATGFGWTTKTDPWPYYWKAPGRATKVAPLAPLPEQMRNVIIHTRYATKGDPSINVNNPPVVAPGLILVHNGVLRNDDDLIALVEHDRVGTVDSEALPALLGAGPLALGESDPAELLALVKGDAAIAWLDGEDPEALHLARLVGRPLSIGWTKRGDLIAASTAAAIQSAARRQGITVERIRDVKEGTYLRVEHGEIVRSSPIRIPRPLYAVPARPAKPKAQAQPVLDDGIDWDNLAPRRGWVGYRNDPPKGTGRTGKFRFDVATQSWVES